MAEKDILELLNGIDRNERYSNFSNKENSEIFLDSKGLPTDRFIFLLEISLIFFCHLLVVLCSFSFSSLSFFRFLQSLSETSKDIYSIENGKAKNFTQYQVILTFLKLKEQFSILIYVFLLS